MFLPFLPPRFSPPPITPWFLSPECSRPPGGQMPQVSHPPDTQRAWARLARGGTLPRASPHLMLTLSRRGGNMLPILQMRKPRHRKVGPSTQWHLATAFWPQSPAQATARRLP